jgi:polyisoprenyl-teichoic acid--peptidoglycan teichoic acid transferase
MDRSRYKRPAIQKQRQTNTNNFGNSQAPVPKVLPARPRPIQSVMAHTVAPIQPVPPPAPQTVNRPVMPVQHAPHDRARFRRPLATQNSYQNLKPQLPPAPASALAPQTPIAQQFEPPQPTVPFDMELPGDESPWHLGGKASRQRLRVFRRFAFRGMAAALVIVITLGGVLFSQSYLKANKVFKGTAGTAAALNANVKPELLKGEGRGRVNILLMGRGGGAHNAPDLTDTLMVASVDPVNGTTTLLSVPRDLWVNVPGQGVMKLNAAWQTGVFKYLGKQINGTTDDRAIQAGFKSIDATLHEVLGLEIDYHLLVDFKAFKQAIDTVGGVNVNVPTDLVDPTMAWENNNDPILAHAGQQAMDGNKALIYARSRETSSDFARGERQRAILLALKSKVANVGTFSNPVKISGLLNAFGDNVQTDLSIKNAQRLYSILKKVDDTNIASISLADANAAYVTTGNINGQSVVLPKAGLFKYGEIQTYIRSQLKDPYIVKEKAKILVLNGTLLPGLATTKATELSSYGYNVFKTGNTPNSGWTQTTLVDVTHKKKYTKNYLEQRFNQKAASKLADSTIPTNGADFVIIIGSNEASLTNNQAN